MSLFFIAACLSISSVFFNLISLKALKVGISRPSLHVYRKTFPNSNIWLSVFHLLSFIGFEPTQVSFVRSTVRLDSVFGLTNFPTLSRKIEYSYIPKKSCMWFSVSALHGVQFSVLDLPILNKKLFVAILLWIYLDWKFNSLVSFVTLKG